MTLRVEGKMTVFKMAGVTGFVAVAAIVAMTTRARAEAESELEPAWARTDCTSDPSYFYFVGRGTGPSKSVAFQGALIEARKNALICVFGGTLAFSSQVSETNTQTEYFGKTSISVSAEHLDWSGFEMMQSQDHDHDDAWSSVARFRWSRADVDTNRKKFDSLEKEREKNRSLAARMKASEAIAAERAALVKKQRQELDELKKHEAELAGLASEKERILAKLAKNKKQKAEKDDAWVSMVTKFGCGTTIADIKPLIGSPDSIEVRGRHLRGTSFKEYEPLLLFIYGNFALVAPVHDAVVSDYDNWDRYKRSADRYEITYVYRYKGTNESWWICRR